MIVEPMARRPNSDAELNGLLRARGQRASFHRLVIHRAVRMLSHHARAGFMPAVPLPQAPLSDGVVALRPLRPEDAGAVIHASQDPGIARWTRLPTLPRGRDARDFIDDAERDRKAGRGINLAVVVEAEAAFAGSIALDCYWEHRKGELGYWITPAARGRHVGTRAVRLIARWAFDELGLERLELLSDPENEPSRRLALRAGFTSEGLLRSYRPGNSGREDLLMFSLLATDPPT